jgi:hypothetical protein
MSMSSYNAGNSSPGEPPDIKPPVNRSTSAPQGKTTINQEPQVAKTAFVATDALREKARYLAGLGVPQDDIAKIIGCAAKTLRRHFRDELDRGVAEANATISGCLFGAAKGGNVTAQIFWLKTRARWREGSAADDPVPSADAGSNSEVILTLPDNNRDPELTQVLRDAQRKYFARKRQR